VLVNNAGHSQQLEPARPGAPAPGWAQHWELDVTGAWRCYQAAAPVMAAAGWGRIVNLYAVPAQRGQPGDGPRDHALEQMTVAMARGLEASGVTVNAVVSRYALAAASPASPGAPAETVDRLATSREVYGAISYLCSPDADWVTGRTVWVEAARRP
jgi:3-oxoacyl-[acyl-carrier protein] reductase